MIYKDIILPSALLAATIIGAGTFALPYVFLKAGFLTGIFYLIVFAVAFSLIHLMYADIILKTGTEHRLLGYGRIYLGEIGFWCGVLAALFGGIIALTIYLVLSVSFVNLILPNLPNIYKLLAFWLTSSIPLFWGVKRVAASEFLITAGIIAAILIIFFYGAASLPRGLEGNLFGPDYLLLPFGSVLFALGGRVAIPSVVNHFQKDNLPFGQAKISIILGTFLPALIYLIFVAGVWSISPNVSQDAVSGLIGKAPALLLWVLGVFGIIALWSTYITILQYVKSGLELDLGWPKFLAIAAAIFAPLVLYFTGLQNFTTLISFAGSVFIGLDAILVILIWLRAKKLKPRSEIFGKLHPAIPWILLIIFGAGIILKIIGYN